MIFKPGDRAKRNVTGAIVNIVEVRPIGDRVCYVVEDCRDGHTTIMMDTDLRPVTLTGESK